MKRVTLTQIPLPDHHPTEAFEFLTGYGLVDKVTPHLGEFSFTVEGSSHAEIMRTLSEIEQEVNARIWWGDTQVSHPFTERFSEYLNTLDLVEVTTTRHDAEQLQRALAGQTAGRIRLADGVRTRLLAALEEVKPVGEGSS